MKHQPGQTKNESSRTAARAAPHVTGMQRWDPGSRGRTAAHPRQDRAASDQVRGPPCEK
jgi:hypothetical protein